MSQHVDISPLKNTSKPKVMNIAQMKMTTERSYFSLEPNIHAMCDGKCRLERPEHQSTRRGGIHHCSRLLRAKSLVMSPSSTSSPPVIVEDVEEGATERPGPWSIKSIQSMSAPIRPFWTGDRMGAETRSRCLRGEETEAKRDGGQEDLAGAVKQK